MKFDSDPIRRVVRYRTELRERRGLAGVSPIACDARRLGQISPGEIERIHHSPEINAKWHDAQPRLGDLGISDQSWGVNAGDRRALYHLVCALEPTRVLEIGTHVGASTMHIAAAMRDAAGEPDTSLRLTTVDIEDVNDPIARPWAKYGSKESPSAMARRLGFDGFIEFVCQSSLDYMTAAPREYDFVFLDGDHSAEVVYREIPLALALLSDGGFILLHDYFPRGAPLWRLTDPLPGPWLAVERLRAEGLRLRAIPLGELPWPTKFGSRITSLAVLSGA